MEASTPHDPAERWLNRYTGEITAPLGERPRADWIHVTFVRDDPAERETIESHFDLKPGEKAPVTTWTVYFDGKPSHWLMREYTQDENGVLPGCKYGFLIYYQEPQYPDLEACANGFALVAAVEHGLIEATYQIDRDVRPYAIPSTQVQRPTKKPMSVQEYVIQALAGAIENQQTKATISYRFSNRGVMYAMRGFKTLASIEFDFQDVNCTLDIKDPMGGVVNHSYAKYTEGEKLEAFIAQVAEFCQQGGF